MEGIRTVIVLFEAIALRKSRDIHPVAGPAFAEVRGFDEFVD